MFKHSSIAPIHAISRHRIGVDGKGVTTLVIFFGCTLRCKYCLNPNTLGTIPNANFLTPQQLYERVKIDELYFRVTGGGITFGGGEPGWRSDFICAFRELCGNTWKLRIETSLNIEESRVIKLIPVVDQWIIDIKAWDEKTYERYTGKNNEQVKSNLALLAKHHLQEKTLIRVPLIPDFVEQDVRDNSISELRKMGFMNFDLFTYRTT